MQGRGALVGPDQSETGCPLVSLRLAGATTELSVMTLGACWQALGALEVRSLWRVWSSFSANCSFRSKKAWYRISLVKAKGHLRGTDSGHGYRPRCPRY